MVSVPNDRSLTLGTHPLLYPLLHLDLPAVYFFFQFKFSFYSLYS